jgi:D-serine deaminase-like pyridoxal phosphate-dependent protein
VLCAPGRALAYNIDNNHDWWSSLTQDQTMSSSVSRRTFFAATAAGAATIPALPALAGSTPLKGAAAARRLEKPIPINDLPTPALLIDFDRMEGNLRKMADDAKRMNVGVRPHTKTHKCPIIAKMQMDLGAVGVCAAKVSEAEVMVANGVDNVLITSPVVTPEKISRVIDLAKRSAGIQMVVDNAKTIDDFDAAAKSAGVKLRVILDLDTGTKRTGVASGAPALALAQQIDKASSLQFDGLQNYAGHLMHLVGHNVRKELSIETAGRAIETKQMIEKSGIKVDVLSGGGTGTFDIDGKIDQVTDLQVGSYLFMDAQYRKIGDADSKVFDYFDPSLFVLVTAISQPVPERITVDGGYKAFASDDALPEFRDITGVTYRWGGDEHGIILLENPSRKMNLGDKMQVMVSHCDPTVNLYDNYHVVRNGQVEELWPIAARGCSQ